MARNPGSKGRMPDGFLVTQGKGPYRKLVNSLKGKDKSGVGYKGKKAK